MASAVIVESKAVCWCDVIIFLFGLISAKSVSADRTSSIRKEE